MAIQTDPLIQGTGSAPFYLLSSSDAGWLLVRARDGRELARGNQPAWYTFRGRPSARLAAASATESLHVRDAT